jgi:putative ABC transport system permease protein
MEKLLQDIRYGFRTLVKNPGFTLAAIIALTLGIGANIAIFSIINAVLLGSLPYKNPDQLVMVWEKKFQGGRPKSAVAVANYNDWKEQSRSFEDIAASTDQLYNLTGEGEPELIIGYRFSPNFFQVLGSEAALGRTFLPEEGQVGNHHVVVLSNRLWQRRFGGDPGVIGRTLTLNGEGFKVVGVMPPEFKHPNKDVELWAPLALDPKLATNRDSHLLRLVGRLRPGVTIEQAQTEMDTIALRLAQQYPATNAGWGVTMYPLRNLYVGDIRPALFLLLGAVGFVLLIACANVANLLLSRATARQKELAIRVALGASRIRLVRQFITEGMLLSILGCVVGLGIAYWAVDALVALFPPTISNLQMPRIEHIPLDGRVMGFTLALGLLTGFIFGIVPMLQASRIDVNGFLKEGGRGSTGGVRGRRVRSLFVVVEMSLALMLLICAGLMIKSFMGLGGNLGYRTENILTMRLTLPKYKYQTPAQQRAFLLQVLQRLQAMPGAQSVGVINYLPLSGWQGGRTFTVEGQPVVNPGEEPEAEYRVVTPDYFRTFDMSLVKGRAFTERDTEGAPQVAIINETMARRFFANEDPVGKHLTVGGFDKEAPREIVGVVKDVKSLDAVTEAKPEIYRPFFQDPWSLVGIAIRTAPGSDPTSLTTAVRNEIGAVDKDQPVAYLMSMSQLASESIASQRVIMILLGVFGGVALVLAVVGIYGVISYDVTQRTHEIGIRMALGARPFDIQKLIVGRGLILALIGVTLGLGGAFALSRVMSSLLYQVSTTDPITFVSLPFLLVGAALAASYIPARRAASVDPMIALRNE